ncbi:MAG TPA: DUF4365 domain-containing protein [Chitinophagales bacterium]|nr:DUF4365 domain-containing protein [Chitinophagales bacterium]
MEREKDISEWRAEKLGYVYFSRLNDLIISEPNFKDQLFDYLIDIGEKQKQTGRLFGVEVKALNPPMKIKNIELNKYKNVSFPALYVLFDKKTDKGFFKWIKKPGMNGHLILDNDPRGFKELNNHSLNSVVKEIRNWYSKNGKH